MALSSCKTLVLAAAFSAAMAISTRAADPAAPTPPAPTPPAATQPETQPASRVVATINGQTITFGELDKETQEAQMQAAGQLPPEAIAEMLPRFRQQAMSRLIDRQLVLQAVAERKITVSEEEVKKVIDGMVKTLPPGETLDTALHHAGIVKADFMKRITEQLSVQKLFTEVTHAAAATDAEVAKFYNEHPDQFKREESVSARHILVMFAPGDDAAKKDEKKKKAEAIRDRLVKGEDFAKVCAETSEDPGSKANGGLYENFTRGKMVAPFENAAFTQKIGDIGPLVETTFGYHIIKVDKHNEAGVTPLAEVKEQLKAFIERPRRQELAQKFVKSLHDTAKITYADGFGPPPVAPIGPAPAPAPTPAPSEPKK